MVDITTYQTLLGTSITVAGGALVAGARQRVEHRRWLRGERLRACNLLTDTIGQFNGNLPNTYVAVLDGASGVQRREITSLVAAMNQATGAIALLGPAELTEASERLAFYVATILSRLLAGEDLDAVNREMNRLEDNFAVAAQGALGVRRSVVASHPWIIGRAA